MASQLWAPSAASNRPASLFFWFWYWFPREHASGKKLVPLLSKVSKPLILVQLLHFINNETEVQRGGGSDLYKIIWPISKRAEMRSHVSWPGQCSFHWLTVNYLCTIRVWLPQLDCWLLEGRGGLKPFWYPCWSIAWLVAGEAVPFSWLQVVATSCELRYWGKFRGRTPACVKTAKFII